MSEWKEAQAPDGRTYYYNTITKATRWDKPEETNGSATPAPPTGPASQLTPEHNAAGWADAKAPDGRTYYFNRNTNETSWSLPPLSQVARAPPVAAPNIAPSGPRGGNDRGFDAPRRFDRRDDRDNGLPQKPAFDGGRPWEGGGFRGAMPVKDEPDYATPEQAREAFFKLLRRHNIKYDTKWTDALRAVVKDRDYRAIKDAKDRKIAFEDYCIDQRAEERTKEKERREKLRHDFRNMLKTHEEIKHYTRWKTARPMIEREVVFRSAGDDDERRHMFEEYILELKRQHVEQEGAARSRALEQLGGLLQTLDLDIETKWADAQEMIMGSDRYQNDPVFRALHKVDVLLAYEKHLQYLEGQRQSEKRKETGSEKRDDRKARDGFRQLLQEKLHTGALGAGTKWQDFVPQIEDDVRYITMIGSTGSSPLDLFWDVVEDEESKLRSKRNLALDILDHQNKVVTPETSVDELISWVKPDPQTARWSHQDYVLVHQRLVQKALQRAEDDKANAEVRQRKAEDKLRGVLKELEPPVRVDDTYEDIQPKIEDTREYKALDDEGRRNAFSRHIRRLQDRIDERARRDRDRDRDRERDRDRDYRNGGSRRSYDYDRERDRDRDRDRRHRTRTPEADAYEADRRKAQEARERSYRKASFGLTPPPRERDRDRRDDRYDRERERDRDRDGRSRFESMYERERREREMERERNYASRADPRDRGKQTALDYGDDDVVGSRPGSVRKRRDSEGSMSSRRDNKVRRIVPDLYPGGDRWTPQADLEIQRSRRDGADGGDAMDVDKEEVALQSGSEEGEIEEV